MTDLTKINGTYTKLLSEQHTKIDTLYADDSVSTGAFRAAIKTVIEAANKTNAYRQFVNRLDRSTSKAAMLFQIYNAIQSACGNAVC
jgi:hypothetical protein